MVRSDDGAAVVVTGASGGIGEATVRYLLEQGKSVVALDLDIGRLNELYAAAGEACLRVAGDVTKESDVEAAISQAVSRFGGLAGMFNNAGVIGDIAPITDYDSRTFERVLSVNLMGAFYGTKHAIRAMRAAGSGGGIVNTASTGGITGAPDLSAYITSKHALIGLTRTAALETTTDSITVNALCPGMVDTPMLASVRDGREAQGREAEGAPTDRAADPHEIAKTAYWLLFERPVYLTGAVIPVDGGLSNDQNLWMALGEVT